MVADLLFFYRGPYCFCPIGQATFVFTKNGHGSGFYNCVSHRHSGQCLPLFPNTLRPCRNKCRNMCFYRSAFSRLWSMPFVKKKSCSVERKNKKPAAPVQRHLLSGARINSGRDIRRRTCLTLDSLLTIGSFIILWLYGRQRATTPFAQGESHAHGKKFHLP